MKVCCLLCGIIGIILLVVAAIRNNIKNNKEKDNHSASKNEKLEEEESEDKEKYTRMFKEPFSEVVCKQTLTINEKKCVIYIFRPSYAISKVCAFSHMIKVEGRNPRYFAVEFSFGNTFCLCEWIFEGEKRKKHIDYGEVFSIENVHIRDNTVKKLKELLI